MKIAIALIAIAAMTTSAFAEGNKNINNTYSQSYSQSRSSSRATGGNAAANNSGNTQTTNFRDRLQAPGFGVGAAYCSNGIGISGPGFGFGGSFMDATCKDEINARMVGTYINKANAAAYLCTLPKFRNSVPACVAAYARSPKR